MLNISSNFHGTIFQTDFAKTASPFVQKRFWTVHKTPDCDTRYLLLANAFRIAEKLFRKQLLKTVQEILGKRTDLNFIAFGEEMMTAVLSSYW